MKEKIVTTSSNKKIHIIDDVFTYSERENFLNYIDTSLYTKNIPVTSSHMGETSFLQANYNQTDLLNMGMMKSNSFNELIDKYFPEYDCYSIWSILTTYLTQHITHTDSIFENNGDMTLLYYANLNWESNYGGETLFASDNGEYERVIEYKPNRVVIFDSTIPHKISPMSIKAPPFRYTFVMRFRKKINL